MCYIPQKSIMIPAVNIVLLFDFPCKGIRVHKDSFVDWDGASNPSLIQRMVSLKIAEPCQLFFADSLLLKKKGWVGKGKEAD